MVCSYKKLATLVGCNYFNTRNELHGCINHVKSMQKLLIERYGFKEEDIVVLTDASDSIMMPTGANIRSTLKQMIERAEPGDTLFFHYSGHGTLIPHRGRRAKKDEAIVPCDFNLITDVDFRQLVDQLPAGASFTIVSDSCHSGGLIDKEKEQIGPESMNTKKRKSKTRKSRERMIPYHEVLQHVASMSAVESEHIGVHLMNVFGSEASKKFTKKDDDEDSTDKNMSEDDGILLSGCQVNETSADMSPEGDDNGGKAYGAFSNAIQTVLNKEREMMSNRELVLKVRELLKEEGFSQHPCLYCSDSNADAPFLGRQD